jgi:Asp-tRNA(Asn)/Glu-tRNA(Gln) amidotransferase A subunit family amidase
MVKIFQLIIISFLMMLISCQSDQADTINNNTVRKAERIIGLNFTDTERDSLLKDLQDNLKDFRKLREAGINNSVPPAIKFNPLPLNFRPPVGKCKFILGSANRVALPDNLQDLAFYSVRDLGILIRTKKITSLELTKIFLERLKKYDPQLHCVITLTKDLALKEARQADEEIAAGKYRGALHGIPYGAKDLLAKKGYKTTWGAMPYKDQVIDEDATVIKKLRDAGAILVAKLTLGALAWGDVWYGERTRNPWNPEQGSSGSSAGPASATAAGLVPFSIGSETWGSIVSPSTRCGTTGLRPTYGRVSRAGAMALSWSMDKLGPICRTVEDCAIVFNAIYGPDGIDQTVVDYPFQYDARMNLKQLRIGYLKSTFDEDYSMKESDAKTLIRIKEMGFKLIPIELPEIPVSSISFILSAEAAAAFDDITLSNKDDQMVRQIRNAWPNVFRSARFIPAVEYIQANRLRYQLIQEMHKVMKWIDIYIAPSFG